MLISSGRFGRDNFQEAMKLAHRTDHTRINWDAFKFMVFDSPISRGNYAERYAQLGTIMPSLPAYLFSYNLLSIANALQGDAHKYVSLAPYVVCKDTTHLEKEFQDIIDQGGEGVILRDPVSPYQAGRSRGFLKHKVKYTMMTVFFFFLVPVLLTSNLNAVEI